MIMEKSSVTPGISVTLQAPSRPWNGTTPEAASPHGSAAVRPDPEVPEKPTRRRFAAEYKLRILKLADACTTPGSLGSLLRREGLYASNLTTWRRQRDRGALAALTPHKRGRQASRRNPRLAEIEQLRKENGRLTQRLRQAELIIDVQKKVSEMLGIPLSAPEAGGSA